ncbi:MAG TPA: trypsin-like serine protease [Pyrinomonadaceae bacterium]|nr:trypsin-like serine protease [Pyrinomonadaceae bacterium]
MPKKRASVSKTKSTNSSKRSRKGKFADARIFSKSSNGRGPSTRLAKQDLAEQPKLPKLPKGGLRDIGELSFGKRPKRPSPTPPEFGVAGSVADRVRVQDVSQSPFRKVCDLLITAGDGSLHSGTAWFVSPRMLVTAGHCIAVFQPGTATHGMVNKILVMAARNGETNAANSLFGWIEVPQENLRVHDRWRLNGDLDFDYGAIILPPNFPLGAKVGVFGFAHFPDQSLNGARATLTGYPDNVPEGTQWFESNPIRSVTPNHIFYDIFTFGGQSGSPVFFANNTQQIACAIHNFGDVPFNRGVRINQSVSDQLQVWQAGL